MSLSIRILVLITRIFGPRFLRVISTFESWEKKIHHGFSRKIRILKISRKSKVIFINNDNRVVSIAWNCLVSRENLDASTVRDDTMLKVYPRSPSSVVSHPFRLMREVKDRSSPGVFFFSRPSAPVTARFITSHCEEAKKRVVSNEIPYRVPARPKKSRLYPVCWMALQRGTEKSDLSLTLARHSTRIRRCGSEMCWIKKK